MNSMLKQPQRQQRLTIISLLVFLLISYLGHATDSIFDSSPRKEIRAIWVTRWDYKHWEDIWKILGNCKDYGFNLVFFQVRGNATVFYPSRIEPWAYELTGKNAENLNVSPGYDPLGTALKYAEIKGIELHPYINILPGWGGNSLPARNAPQLYAQHRDWFMMDQNRNYMHANRQYAFLNPALPQVRHHLVNVVTELVFLYRPKGIHFDYLRYPHEHGDFSFDPYSIREFNRKYHFYPKPDSPEWSEWRSDQTTELKRMLYTAARRVNPNIHVSAAVMDEDTKAEQKACQPAKRWMNEGILDVSVPMLYADTFEKYASCARSFKARSRGKPVVAGILFQRGRTLVRQKISYARELELAGFAIFAYSSLFPDHQPSRDAQWLKEVMESSR